MHKPQPFHIQLYDLLLMELSNWRWSWSGTLITGMIAPVLSIMALGAFIRTGSEQDLPYILTGNIVLSLTFQMMEKMCSRFSFLRAANAFDFYAVLPIRRAIFVTAITISFFLLGLPALLTTLLFGTYYLGLPVAISPLLPLVLVAATLPLAGIGALIGTTVEPPDQANTVCNILVLLLMGLGPVILPPDRLHPVLLALGWLSPASYAASALRQTLLGPPTLRLAFDLLMLSGFALLSFWWVGKKMNWRQLG